ncbi:hypothetical protein EDB80DRAFT_836636 [Ilyonectria destructans]|nr:hypothetical protein EDB80DRAFT_836636 [Ilyonectria destructans]
MAFSKEEVASRCSVGRSSHRPVIHRAQPAAVAGKPTSAIARHPQYAVPLFHKPPLEASLNCYPWLIVEHKKEGVRRSEETVCCQSANAGACAVKLNQIAARYAVELGDDAQIPPVSMVTTIGSRVKVWIMYFARGFYAPSNKRFLIKTTWESCKKGYVMRAIWEGDMTKLEDIVKFQLILENTHTWAMRAFKPLISSYIDQWKLVHCQVGIAAANTALLHRQQIMERCQTVLPMVQSFLNNHSAIELDDSKHSKVTPLLMGLLVQQICTLERQALTNEVDRIVTKRIRALNLNLERITIETQQTSQRRRISTSSHLSGLSSLGPTVDNDDPNDGDYVASQVTDIFQTMRLVPEFSDAESQLRRRSTILGASNTSTPTVPIFSGRVSVNSPDGGAATPKPPQLSQTQDSETTVGETPPKSVLFPFNDSKWPPGTLFPQPPSSPEPPIIDWKSKLGPVRF